MKIAIFGDSFAAPLHKFKKDIGLKSWADHLAEKYDITNYAVEGSSLYYSVKKFISVNQLYDKIIFVITLPGRLYLNENPILEQHNHEHISSLALAEHMYNYYKDSVDTVSIEFTTVAQAAIQYFTHIQRINYERFVHNLQIDYIKSIRPDIILLPAFTDSYHFDINNICLYDITELEHAHWGIPRDYGSPGDYRRCHMSKENNLILANLADRWLQGEPVNINISDFVVPLDDKSFYNIK